MSKFDGITPLILLPFSLNSNIQINIQEYNHKMICISHHAIKCAMSCIHLAPKIVSEYDQEIPQSQTSDNPVAPREKKMLNHHETPGRQLSKATSSLFPIKMVQY